MHMNRPYYYQMLSVVGHLKRKDAGNSTADQLVRDGKKMSFSLVGQPPAVRQQATETDISRKVIYGLTPDGLRNFMSSSRNCKS